MNRTRKTTKTPARRRSSRAVVGVGLVLGALNAQLALANPAYAFLPGGDQYHETSGGPWTGDYWGDYWDTQGGEGPGTDTSEQDNSGVILVGGRTPKPLMEISDVMILLTQPSCRSLIKGSSSFDPEQVWRTIPKYDAGATKPSNFEDGNKTLAEASGSGVGPDGHITIYTPWHHYGFDPTDFPSINPSTDLIRTPTASEIRSLFLLHELAHITGALPPHIHPDTGRAFNALLLDRCLGLVRH